MWKLLGVAAATVTIFGATQPPLHQSPAAAEKATRLAMICFNKGEETSGRNKICYCAGSAAAITVGAAQLCPLSINR